VKSAVACRGEAVILPPTKEDIKQRWTKCIAKAYIRLHGRQRDANTGGNIDNEGKEGRRKPRSEWQRRDDVSKYGRSYNHCENSEKRGVSSCR
jgi:hypothetical protein